MIYSIQTYSGKLLDYLHPQLDQICIEDIAKSLSQECRFASQSRIHYSVAQHSYMVCGYAPKQFKLEALLHDAEEAYVKDLPTPLVNAMSRGMVSQYRYIKKQVRRAIYYKFGLDITVEEYKAIKQIDLRMTKTEQNFLFKNPLPLYEGEDIEPYNIQLIPENMIDAQRKFLEFYEMYRRDK